MSEMHFATVWELIADEQPGAPALICGEATRSWGEYESRAANVAGYLDQQGHKPDAKIGSICTTVTNTWNRNLAL